MYQRGSFRGRPAPGPFHCLGCKSYVVGTESGHCPRCGYVPPVSLAVPEETRGLSVTLLAAILILLVLLVRFV